MQIRPVLALLFGTVVTGSAGSAPSAASARPTLAPIVAHTNWLATRPDAAAFAGRVVLVDIFTFGCYNCKNVTPNLRALYKKHDPRLAIIGVHTPETPYEADRKNVGPALADLGIVWPVALDNEHALWDAYDTTAWPTQLIFDKHGRLRSTIVGDSQDAAVDAELDTLLAEK